MRIRRLLLTALIAVGPVLALPATAWAASDGEAGHAELKIGECEGAEAEEVLAAAEAGDNKEANELLEDCYSGPSPVFPKVSEMILGGLAWLLVMGALVKFAFPALKKGMKAREDRIRGDLEAAEHAKQSANTELEQYRAQLADARNEAGRIIEEARQAADQVRRDLVARAETEAAELRARAQEDVRLAGERAMADLRTQVAGLSIELAEKIVERNLDRDTQMALVESYINQVGSN